jgi:hypothetical protein
MKLTPLLRPGTLATEATAHDKFELARLTIDPDRDGPTDVVERLLPVLAELAYVQALHANEAQARLHGAAQPVTATQVEEELDRLLDHLSQAFATVSPTTVRRVVRELEQPLL